MKRIKRTIITIALLGISLTNVNSYANGREHFRVGSTGTIVKQQGRHHNVEATIIGATLVAATVGGVISAIIGDNFTPHHGVHHAPAINHIDIRYEPPPPIFYDEVANEYHHRKRTCKTFFIQKKAHHNKRNNRRHQPRHF